MVCVLRMDSLTTAQTQHVQVHKRGSFILLPRTLMNLQHRWEIGGGFVISGDDESDKLCSTWVLCGDLVFADDSREAFPVSLRDTIGGGYVTPSKVISVLSLFGGYNYCNVKYSRSYVEFFTKLLRILVQVGGGLAGVRYGTAVSSLSYATYNCGLTMPNFRISIRATDPAWYGEFPR